MPNQPRKKPSVDVGTLPHVRVVAAPPPGTLTADELAEKLAMSANALRNRVYRHVGRGGGMPCYAAPGNRLNAYTLRFDVAECIAWEQQRIKSRIGGPRDGAGRPGKDGRKA